jgi:hypothetical protein
MTPEEITQLENQLKVAKAEQARIDGQKLVDDINAFTGWRFAISEPSNGFVYVSFENHLLGMFSTHSWNQFKEMFLIITTPTDAEMQAMQHVYESQE